MRGRERGSRGRKNERAGEQRMERVEGEKVKVSAYSSCLPGQMLSSQWD